MNEKDAKSVTLTIGLTQYRRRDLAPWLRYDDFLGRWLPVSQTQCEMLDHIATRTNERDAATKLVAEQHDVMVAMKNEREALNARKKAWISRTAQAEAERDALRAAVRTHVETVSLKAHPTVTPPTRERAEPEGCLGEYCSKGCCGPTETIYRHPATIADAIALLVREGWVDQEMASSPDKNLFREKYRRHGDTSVRVLIASTPEVK